MLRYGAAELRLGAGLGQIQVEVERGRALAHQLSEGDLEADLDVVHERIAGHREGPPQGPGDDLGVELGDPFLAARGRIPVDHGAVANADAVEAHLIEHVAARLAPRGAARRRRLGFGDLPVLAPVGQDLDQDGGADEDNALDLHLALHQREQGNPHLKGFEIDHGRRRSALDVREPHLVGGERRRRKQGQADVAVHGQGAPGQLADLGGDPSLMRVPIDEVRADQDGGDQKNEEAEQRESQLLQGGFLR